MSKASVLVMAVRSWPLFQYACEKRISQSTLDFSIKKIINFSARFTSNINKIIMITNIKIARRLKPNKTIITEIQISSGCTETKNDTCFKQYSREVRHREEKFIYLLNRGLLRVDG